MDLAFLSRGLTGEDAAAPEYGLLIALVAAWQLSTEAARAETLATGAGVRHPLVDILLASGGWREAAVAQGGCFNARHARHGKRSSTEMTEPFTLAF